MVRFLMSPPDYFEVNYEINEWMDTTVPVDALRAQAEWQQLRETLEGPLGATVQIVPAQPGLPDMIFTANAGVVLGQRVLLAHFRYHQRQGEEAHLQQWFEENGFEVLKPPHQRCFEGAGDALAFGETYLAGYHSRTEIKTHNWLAALSRKPVISFRLENPKFYHVDVALCPTEQGDLMVYPKAFSREDWDMLCLVVPPEKRIIVSADEAYDFACNAISVGRHVVLGSPAPLLTQKLEERGYSVHHVPLQEIKKAGGSVKCCTLRLD